MPFPLRIVGKVVFLQAVGRGQRKEKQMDYQDVRDGPNRHDTSRDNKSKPSSTGGFFYYSLVQRMKSQAFVSADADFLDININVPYCLAIDKGLKFVLLGFLV